MKKLNKREGLDLLKHYQLPIVQILNTEELLKSNAEIKEGLSVRLSPPKLSRFASSTEDRNVYLPSIHNCKDIEQIKAFINEHSKKYNAFIHKTVKPELIGSASRLETWSNSKLAMDIYKNLDDRKHDIIHNSMTMPVFGDVFMTKDIEMKRQDEQDYKTFIEVFQYLRKFPLRTYNLEYVIENGSVLFTDLSVDKNLATIYDDELKDYKKQGHELQALSFNDIFGYQKSEN